MSFVNFLVLQQLKVQDRSYFNDFTINSAVTILAKTLRPQTSSFAKRFDAAIVEREMDLDFLSRFRKIKENTVFLSIVSIDSWLDPGAIAKICLPEVIFDGTGPRILTKYCF